MDYVQFHVVDFCATGVRISMRSNWGYKLWMQGRREYVCGTIACYMLGYVFANIVDTLVAQYLATSTGSWKRTQLSLPEKLALAGSHYDMPPSL